MLPIILETGVRIVRRQFLAIMIEEGLLDELGEVKNV